MVKKGKKSPPTLMEAFHSLLMGRKASTQEEICSNLEQQGYEINQSKASRLLRKIGAIKVVNEQGQTVYSLPREPAPPHMQTPLRDLILDIVSNETLIIVFTSPGSASMVARVLDYNLAKTEILGTLAGDDTIFVAPKSIHKIDILLREIKEIFNS